MENKKNYFVRNMLCLVLVVVLVGCVALCSVGMVASAATDEQSSDVEARGLMTTITLRLSVGNGKVYVQAHNEFTLGPSTIQVYVYLYSSYSYTEDYNQMFLENKNYIGDLNINKTLETSANIGEVARYWRGRVYYQLDKKDWVSKETNTVLVKPDGTVEY
ncbi:MAG: hypothetical protein K2L70_03045 [Clostridia bacterium]|nr:hypothetical protein [Clostridia bacterium]